MHRFTSHSSRRPTQRLAKVLTLATTAALPSLAIIASHIPAVAANINMH